VAEDLSKTKLIVSLLHQTSSLPVVSEFLKEKGLTHSAGSWDVLLNKRIIPAISNHQISNDDLITLLSSAEECGHQHIFLYKCPKDTAIEIMARDRITGALKKMALQDLLTTPKVLEQPSDPQIVDVRWETAKTDLSLTIKEVSSRKYRRHLDTEQHDGKIYEVYGIVEERAVNVAKIHRNGLLEIRIASISNSNKYDSEVHRFRGHIKSLIPIDSFSELSLSVAKDRLWTERATLQKLIRYSDSTIRDEAGNALRAVTGSIQSDLSANPAVGNSLDYLLEQDENSYCEGANIWFNKSSELSADIHVLLTGDLNEFALPANCTEGDYNYVLHQLRQFNHRVS